MVIINSGLNRVRDTVNDDITVGQLGTGTAIANESDTGLSTPTPSTIIALGTNSKTDKTIKFTYTLLSTNGESDTFTEFELARVSSGTAIATHYDRIRFTGIAFVKDGVEDIIISKKYFFRGE